VPMWHRISGRHKPMQREAIADRRVATARRLRTTLHSPHRIATRSRRKCYGPPTNFWDRKTSPFSTTAFAPSSPSTRLSRTRIDLSSRRCVGKGSFLRSWILARGRKREVAHGSNERDSLAYTSARRRPIWNPRHLRVGGR